MIACDTSSLIAFFANDDAGDVRLIVKALKDAQLVLPPPVLSEILSDPKLPADMAGAVMNLPLLDTLPGFWSRVGKTRARIIAKRHKARLADALIAQSCIDHKVGLITRDSDFKRFEGLTVIL